MAGRPRRYSDWHRQRVRAAYRRLQSIVGAAAAAHVSASWAYALLVDAGEITNHPPRFTTRVRNEALELYASGLSCRGVERELAQNFSPAPSQESIHQWARAAGILRNKSRADELQNARRNGRNYDAIRERAKFLADERLLSVRLIARILRVSRNLVKRAIGEENRCDPSEATIRRTWQAFLPDVERRRLRRDEVLARREDGETYAEIAVATGLSISTIYGYCHLLGGLRGKRGRPRIRRAA